MNIFQFFNLDTDVWQEIIDTLSKNKLRTVLTSMSVAWGIFILVLFVGVGRGLQNGIEYSFRDDATNSIWTYQGKTTLPYKGLPVGRSIQFTNNDYEMMKTSLPGVEYISSRFRLRGEFTVSYKDKSFSSSVRAVLPDYQQIEKIIIANGRFLNQIDIKKERKVAVVGRKVSGILFGTENPMGKYINIKDVLFKVVGVFRDIGGDREEERIYIPVSTAQKAYGGRDHVQQIIFTIENKNLIESELIAKKARTMLAEKHKFRVEDKKAVNVYNNFAIFDRFTTLIKSTQLFMWVVGIGTLIAGAVGVSNILLITVKERTREIGIRKALGATPRSIISLIMLESLFVTAIPGYIGLVAGIGVLELVNQFIPPSDFFRYPHVDLSVAVSATLLLVVASTLAGLIPAKKAAGIPPVAALRNE